MKKLLLVLAVSALFFGDLKAQDSVITGNITSDAFLSSSKTYLLKGLVRVQAGATLTIEPGTIIFGANDGSPDPASALIVKPGGKIIADGTVDRPIIFTSEFAKQGSPQEPTYGDWAGVIILGNAPINVSGGTATIEGPGDEFGGNNPDDDSGILRYVRIEYTGYAYSLNNEINGLTMGGVGRGTTLEYIQVSFCGDDSFEWFGGNVNAKYLISFRSWDDDFDTDFGYNGKLQYLVALVDPQVADQSSSNGFESDNDGSGSLNEPRTSPTWWNVTLVGPKFTDTTTVNSLYARGMHLRRSSLNKVTNTIIMGWPRGIRLDGVNTIQGAINGDMWVNNSIIAGWTSSALDTVSSGGLSFDVNAWFTNAGGRTFTTNAEVMLTNPFDLLNPDFRPMSGSPALAGGATPPDDGFFNPLATFIGAFGEVDWTEGWTNWAPRDYVLSVEAIDNNIPASFELSQNFPNPFNPSTTINYHIPESGNVKIAVYDVLGNLVEEIINEYQNAGNYKFDFDASHLSSGVYVYQLITNNFISSKKMTLIK
jgi:hypothetical protein